MVDFGSETQNFYAVIAVCGVGTDGKVVGHEWGHKHNYGGYGANLWVCAPWDALAADDSNGYVTGSGTSASTAMVSGVAALVRSANPELTWRDVKLILAASARQNDTGHEDWATAAIHYGGGPDRYHFNPNFGFGVVDAAAAVALAKPWVNLPPMTEAHRSTPVDYNREIPENFLDHVNLEPLQVSFGILDDGRTTPQFVEHVEINVDLDHKSVGNLDIWITSPNGTVSRLAWPNRGIYPIKRDHSFGSSRHLGENPVGLWTLSVIDRGARWQGQLKGASITIRGHRNVESTGDNSKPTGEPTVSGTAQVGQSLNVDTSTISDKDGLTNAVFRYQWITSDQTADTEIRGATEAAYTLDEEDVGKSIWLRVTFTDDAGNEETLTSTPSAPVAARPNTPATGLPTISSTAQVAETLAASISDIEDADGLTGATFSYQWVSSDGITDTDIREATSATYTLVVDDIGKTITVRVNYTDDRGFDETLTSAPTAVVEASPNIPATGLPSITGAAEVGETLTVSTSGIQDANGLSGATFSYQWVSNDGTADMDIQEVTSTSYTLVADDIGRTIKVRVSFTDDGGNEETLTSAPTAAVEAKLNIPATGLLTIRGKAQVGETLTADPSGVADHNGLENANFSYRWLADDTAIDGATGREYTLAEADKGKAIKVRVSFTDDGGNEETLTSAPTAPVWGDGPPGAPGKLTITPGDKEVTLSWEPPDDNGNPPVKSYRIEWRIDGKDYEKNHWGTSRSTTYTTNDQANLANGVKYFFRVKAGNGDGNRKGPYGPASEEVSATPTSGSAVNLGTPVLSNTENLHHRMMRLDWQDIEDAGWYVVQYYHIDGGGGEWLDLPAVGVDIAFHGSSAVVTNLDYGIHWLRVGAASCAGSSEWSQIEELYGTRASDWKGVPVPEVEEGDEIEPCPVVLGTPVLSEPENLHHGMVKLDWQDIEDAGWYVVQYYHVKGGEWLDLPAEGVDIAFHGSSAVVSNLHGLSWLRVGAASCDGASEWSQIEQLFGTNASDWEGVPVPEVAEGDEIEPCDEDPDTPDNSPATGAPTISGTARVGEVLEVDTSGIADANGLSNVQYEYQWLADDVDIAGATGSTYTLVAEDEGKAIKVQVGFTDDAGNEETLTSVATDAVSAAPTPNSPATGAPTIAGTAQVGETLTANTTGVADADGLSSVQYEYQWLANDSDISGATNATYTLVAEDEGKAIKLEVTFIDDAGNEETLTSAATDAVAAAPTPNSPVTKAYITVVIASGDDTVSWSDPGGCSSDYNIYKAITPSGNDSETSHIHLVSAAPGSTQATLNISHSEDDRYPAVEVELYCGTYDAASSQNLLISSTQLSIGGTSLVGINIREGTYSSAPLTALTISSGMLSPDFDRGLGRYSAEVPSDVEVITLNPTVLTGYQTDFVKNPGLYTVTVCRGSMRLNCVYTYGDGTTTGIVLSDADTDTEGFQINLDPGENRLGIGVHKGPVAAGPARAYPLTITRAANTPATGQPTINGTAQVGEVLEVDTSGIADADGLANVTFSYQWLSSRDTEIGGATSSRYTLQASDESKAVKVQVSFTDDAGNDESLTSAATDPVAAAPTPNSPATGTPTISGTAQVGETLTANTYGVADADGLANATFSYQWLADGAEIAGATGSTYTLTDSEESKAITVQVSFTDDADNEETLTSAATDVVAGAQPTEPPAKPRKLDATATHDSVTVTWDDPGDDSITGYVILRRIPGVDPQGHFDELVPNTGSAATTYTDNTVAAGTTYTYRIKAVNGAGTSERSRWYHIDVPAAPVPDKPTGLEATESDGQVVLTWDDPGDDSITGYVILRRVRENNTGGDFSVLVADTGTAATTYTDATVAAGTTYTYRIKAINEHGTSERSRWFHIDIPEAP